MVAVKEGTGDSRDLLACVTEEAPWHHGGLLLFNKPPNRTYTISITLHSFLKPNDNSTTYNFYHISHDASYSFHNEREAL